MLSRFLSWIFAKEFCAAIVDRDRRSTVAMSGEKKKVTGAVGPNRIKEGATDRG